MIDQDRTRDRSRVLITGAAGFIGGHVAREAVRQGRDVVLLEHQRPVTPTDSGTARIVTADLGDPVSLRGICEGVDVVLHCASYVGQTPDINTLVNTDGTRNLVAEAVRSGVSRIVYVSTASVYGRGIFRDAQPAELDRDPGSPTSRSRADAEDIVLEAGGIVLRPHLVYGEGDKWVVPTMARLLRALPATVDGWPAKASAISAAELARLVVATGFAPAAALSSPIYHAADPEPLVVRTLLEAVAESTGLPWPAEDLSPAQARELLADDRQLTHALTMLATDHWFNASTLWRDLDLRPDPSGGSIMNPVPRALPISGLSDMSTESRMIATPWSRMLRGIGLGQYPIDYDPTIAGHIRDTFDRLAAKVSPSDGYTLFCRKLTDFTLKAVDPDRDRAWVESAVGPLLDAARAVPNPYFRATAGSILMDAFAKLGLDLSLLVNAETDFPAEVLAMLDEIVPDGIADENQGRHGEYPRVSACSTVFLAIGQLGLRDRLVTAERNHIREALNLLERIPVPYFCGRAGGMLLSVIALLGYSEQIFDGERDYMREVLEYLTRADEIGNWPKFPMPMPTPWKKVYPLLTMLNAAAMCGRPEYLTEPFDALAEARSLMGQIPWNVRVHMAQYYVIALHNLGRLAEEIPDLDAFMKDVAAVLDIVDPGENYSPRGNAYPYIIELAMMTGRMDLIPDAALTRVADSFIDLDKTEDDRANRAFPVSYVINILGEIGAPELVFAPRDRYAGLSAAGWFVENLSEGAKEEGDRISMIDHCLVSYALRMRGADAGETELFGTFAFPFNG